MYLSLFRSEDLIKRETGTMDAEFQNFVQLLVQVKTWKLIGGRICGSIFRRHVSRGVCETGMVVVNRIPTRFLVATFNAPAVIMLWRIILAGLVFPFNLKRQSEKADSPKCIRHGGT